MRSWLLAISGLVLFAATGIAEESRDRLYIGKSISEGDAGRHGVSILPDGSGLPPGRGSAEEGAPIYAAQCASCHGERGEGRDDYPALVGGRGSLSTDKPLLTVGSYWPTATTLFDYLWRGMPYAAPGSLTADETYALTAWILSANAIVKPTKVMDSKSLPLVRMPNADGFTEGHPSARSDMR